MSVKVSASDSAAQVYPSAVGDALGASVGWLFQRICPVIANDDDCCCCCLPFLCFVAVAAVAAVVAVVAVVAVTGVVASSRMKCNISITSNRETLIDNERFCCECCVNCGAHVYCCWLATTEKIDTTLY